MFAKYHVFTLTPPPNHFSGYDLGCVGYPCIISNMLLWSPTEIRSVYHVKQPLARAPFAGRRNGGNLWTRARARDCVTTFKPINFFFARYIFDLTIFFLLRVSLQYLPPPLLKSERCYYFYYVRVYFRVFIRRRNPSAERKTRPWRVHNNNNNTVLYTKPTRATLRSI